MDTGADSYRRFLDGDENGLADLIRDYKDGLILYLNGLTQNLYEAEELAEETFVKLVVKKPVFFRKSAFKTWLYAIARHAAVDALRRRAHTADLSAEAYELMCREEESLEQSYIREERKRTVHRALHKLNPAYYQVLWLLYFEDFDHAGAAAVMKKSKRQIENLVYRAKQSLKAELEKEGFVYEDI